MYIRTLNKRIKTRDTARETLEKNINKALQLIEYIDKYATFKMILVNFWLYVIC